MELEQKEQKDEYHNVDGFLRMVGEFGKFQKILDAIFCFIFIPSSFQNLIMYFAAFQPDWRCVANSTICNLNGTFSSENEFRCGIPRSEWEFTQPKDYSIVTEYDIYCDTDWAVYMSFSIFFIGWIFGSVVLGWISDNYGRKNVLFVSIFFFLLFGLSGAFMPNIGWFLFSRFVVGFFKPGLQLGMFVLMNEIVGERYRPGAGIVFWFFFTIALCIMGLTAYFIRKWKTLMIISAAPYFVVLLFYKFVPESVRWLRLKGRFDEALDIFQKVADWNGKTLDPNAKIARVLVVKNHASPIDLFKTKKLAKKTLLQGFAWLVNGMAYYGISLAANDFGGDLYRDYVLVSIIEFPAALLAIYLCNKVGRKKTTTCSLFVAGFLTLIVGFIPMSSGGKIARLSLGMLGKMFITISFDAIYTWSVEIHSTNIRTEGMGFLQITSRLGAASAPWIAKAVRSVYAPLPFLIMGGLGLLGGISCLFLPETKGVQTQETEEETTNMESNLNKQH
ncbi:organic cation transporter protein-like [Clytia hemisphaerica]|uniref:Major facilitator superfamily (MFS) profile domain-containing protein n=1 Tax=Clytia hemisphaerica TaxID=252671 RepID=A0A7M5WWJ4_9CNID